MVVDVVAGRRAVVARVGLLVITLRIAVRHRSSGLGRRGSTLRALRTLTIELVYAHAKTAIVYLHSSGSLCRHFVA